MNKTSNKSLEEVHASVNTKGKSGIKGLFAFLGPAYMISVGYMDPGNWATDIAGGSQFGYSLIWVLLMSNLIALLLQSHCARLGIVSGKDLAQASKESYPPFVNLFLYILAEIAIAACDLAEVIGMAIGIHLLFPSVSLVTGVCLTVLDSFLLLFLLNKGIRKLEAIIISLVLLIGVSFFIELLIAKPDFGEIAKGIIPGIANEDALYIAIGIIGATVMPHNLYLHSSLVQTRKFDRNNAADIKKAIKFNLIDSTIALNFALFVNAAILILAAASFFKNGLNNVAEIQDAHRLLEPMLGSTLAPVLFAVALIAAGQSSTVTGTLAGQVVMEGYLNLRLQPWIRRLITRCIAIIPALLTVLILGEGSTGKLLILSQVILSLQLGFAIIPLIHFVSDKTKMGEFTIPLWQKVLSWLAALVIIGLNFKMVYRQLADMIIASDNPILISFTIVPLCLFCAMMLLYIIILPLVTKAVSKKNEFHGQMQPLEFSETAKFKKIGISVDFSSSDNKAINKALNFGGKDAEYVLVHVLESANAVVYGENAFDMEREQDYAYLKQYCEQLKMQGYKCEIVLGFGNPKNAIPNAVNKAGCDMLVMGTHGHKAFKDILLGTTIEGVRHNIKIPLILV